MNYELLDMEPIQQSNPVAWEPESVAKLLVGTRVRYRISAECGYACTNCGNNLHYLERWGERGVATIFDIKSEPLVHDKQDGCGATVFDISHNYALLVDGYGEGFWACAAELSVLEGADVETAG